MGSPCSAPTNGVGGSPAAGGIDLSPNSPYPNPWEQQLGTPTPVTPQMRGSHIPRDPTAAVPTTPTPRGHRGSARSRFGGAQLPWGGRLCHRQGRKNPPGHGGFGLWLRNCAIGRGGRAAAPAPHPTNTQRTAPGSDPRLIPHPHSSSRIPHPTSSHLLPPPSSPRPRIRVGTAALGAFVGSSSGSGDAHKEKALPPPAHPARGRTSHEPRAPKHEPRALSPKTRATSPEPQNMSPEPPEWVPAAAVCGDRALGTGGAPRVWMEDFRMRLCNRGVALNPRFYRE